MNPDQLKLKHADLLYDYVKFHLGLYAATPTALAIIGNVLEINRLASFHYGMFCMIAVYLLAGAHAAWLIASHINVEWQDQEKWVSFGAQASAWPRRIIQHHLYWGGLLIALGFMLYGWKTGR